MQGYTCRIMKTFTPASAFLTGLAALVMLAFVSCEKIIEVGPPIEDDGPREEIDGKMTARINGIAYSANATEAAITTNGLTITGIDSTGTRISLFLRAANFGIYELDSNMAAASITKTGTEPYFTASGTSFGQVRILKIDTLKEIISGTFSFVAKRSSDGSTKNVTEGEFEMNYTPMVVIDDPGTDTSKTPATGSVSAIVEADTFTSSSVTYNNNYGKLNFEATDGQFEMIRLEIPAGSQPGTLVLDSLSAGAGWYSASQLIFRSDSGSIQINTHDTVQKIIKGSFVFRVQQVGVSGNSRLVRSDLFDIDY